MRRKKSSIPSLVAARVRPVRRSPQAGRDGEPGPNHWLHRGIERPDADAPRGVRNDAVVVREAAKQVGDALDAASEAMNKIHALIIGLVHEVRPADCANRRPPHEIAALQPRIDAGLGAIREMVDSTRYGGRCLLEGAWSTTLSGVDSGEPRSIHIRSLDPGRLGDVRVGFLASIGSGGAHELRRATLGTVQSVIEHAAAQVSRWRDEIRSYCDEVVTPLLEVLDVAAENADAAANAVRDPDLAVKTSQLSRVDVFMSTSAPQSRPICRTPFRLVPWSRSRGLDHSVQ